MDVFNRPPAIAEETLHYSIYPPQDLCDKPSATSLAACIASYVESLLPGFIWHRDPFDLKVVSDPDSECDGWMLEGTMRVGDCVDDEWCVVWLLKEISARWDVAVRHVSVILDALPPSDLIAVFTILMGSFSSSRQQKSSLHGSNPLTRKTGCAPFLPFAKVRNRLS
jgi:hypothetical protein